MCRVCALLLGLSRLPSDQSLSLVEKIVIVYRADLTVAVRAMNSLYNQMFVPREAKSFGESKVERFVAKTAETLPS